VLLFFCLALLPGGRILFNVQLAQTKISGENTKGKIISLLHGMIAFGSLAQPPRLALQTWNCPYLLAEAIKSSSTPKFFPLSLPFRPY
jgi:hypothetical protein